MEDKNKQVIEHNHTISQMIDEIINHYKSHSEAMSQEVMMAILDTQQRITVASYISAFPNLIFDKDINHIGNVILSSSPVIASGLDHNTQSVLLADARGQFKKMRLPDFLSAEAQFNRDEMR